MLTIISGGGESPRTRALASLNSQQLRRLGSETAEVLILRIVLVHPLDGQVVPLAGLVLRAELPVGHCQKEPVEAVGAFAKRGQGSDSTSLRHDPALGAPVRGGAQVVAALWAKADAPLKLPPPPAEQQPEARRHEQIRGEQAVRDRQTPRRCCRRSRPRQHVGGLIPHLHRRQRVPVTRPPHEQHQAAVIGEGERAAERQLVVSEVAPHLKRDRRHGQQQRQRGAGSEGVAGEATHGGDSNVGAPGTVSPTAAASPTAGRGAARGARHPDQAPILLSPDVPSDRASYSKTSAERSRTLRSGTAGDQLPRRCSAAHDGTEPRSTTRCRPRPHPTSADR
jgi:hypothetical protein